MDIYIKEDYMLKTIYDEKQIKVNLKEVETYIDDNGKPRTFFRYHIYGNSQDIDCFNASCEITAIEKLKPISQKD